MKKFLLLPLILAVGFGILVLLSSESTGNNEDEKDFVTTASGLKYKDLQVGDGPEAKFPDRVAVHYTGWLKDGTKFDSSRDRNEPLEFTIGGRVIKGWNEGVPGMKVGGKRKLVIPAELGYGSTPKDKIPPNSVLVFEVELLEIKPPPA